MYTPTHLLVLTKFRNHMCHLVFAIQITTFKTEVPQHNWWQAHWDLEGISLSTSLVHKDANTFCYYSKMSSDIPMDKGTEHIPSWELEVLSQWSIVIDHRAYCVTHALVLQMDIRFLKRKCRFLKLIDGMTIPLSGCPQDECCIATHTARCSKACSHGFVASRPLQIHAYFSGVS